LSTFLIIERDDLPHPKVQAIVEARGVAGEFRTDATQWVVLAEDKGVPFAFVSLAQINDHPIIEHLAVRSGFWTARRRKIIADLVDRFVEEAWRRSVPYLLTRLDRKAKNLIRLTKFCDQWHFVRYKKGTRWEWWVLYREWSPIWHRMLEAVKDG
jgi:hypothetical protein